jgi:hypothetical protein
MANPKKIELSPSIPPWEKQPGETRRRYDQFRVYLDMGRGRTLPKTAEKLGLTLQHLWDLSKAGQWTTRVDAYNEHLDAVYHASFIEKAQEAAEEDASMLRAVMATVGESLMLFKQAGIPLSPDQAIKWLDVAMKYRRQIYGDPSTATERRQQAQDQQTPVQVEVRHFAELPDEGKLNALRDLMADNERWLAAASDQDDD